MHFFLHKYCLEDIYWTVGYSNVSLFLYFYFFKGKCRFDLGKKKVSRIRNSIIGFTCFVCDVFWVWFFALLVGWLVFLMRAKGPAS